MIQGEEKITTQVDIDRRSKMIGNEGMLVNVGNERDEKQKKSLREKIKENLWTVFLSIMASIIAAYICGVFEIG